MFSLHESIIILYISNKSPNLTLLFHTCGNKIPQTLPTCLKSHSWTLAESELEYRSLTLFLTHS